MREDIDQQMQSGTAEQQAFENAVARVGEASILNAEFAKNKALSLLPGGSGARTSDRVLGALWLAGCVWSFVTVARWFVSHHPAGNSPTAAFFCLNGVMLAIYLVGTIASFFLVYGDQWCRRVVRMMALLMFIACAGQALNPGMFPAWRLWCGVVAVFSLVSIWLLNAPPSHPKPKAGSA